MNSVDESTTLKRLERKITMKNDSENAAITHFTMLFPKLISSNCDGESCHTRMLFGVESLYHVIWDIYILVCLLFQAFWIPFSLGLDIPLRGWLVYFDVCITLTFILDILVNFNTTVNDHGTIIKDRWFIMKSYMKLWFWIDLVSSFPYEWAISGSIGEEEDIDDSSLSKAPQALRLLKILRFIRMLKLLRLAKLKQIMYRVEDYMSNEFMYIIFIMSRMAIVIFFIAHWTACIFFYTSNISATEYPNSFVGGQDLKYYSAVPVSDKYVSVLYWATTTMITLGYGDISASNFYEMIWAIIGMTISCGYYAYVLGKITGFISDMAERDQERTKKHTSLNRYLKKKKLPYWLYFKVKRYLNYISEKHQREIEEGDFMETLSIPIKNDIYSYLYKDTMNSCKFMKKLFPQFLMSTFIKLLHSETFSPGDIVIHEGQVSRTIYFIRTGSVSIFNLQTLALFRELKDTDSFGDIGFFFGRPRTASVVCMKFTEFMTLTWSVIEAEINKYPLILEFLDAAHKESVKGNYKSIKLKCYVCDSKTHIAPHCDMVLFSKNLEESKMKWLKSKRRAKIINAKAKSTKVRCMNHPYVGRIDHKYNRSRYSSVKKLYNIL